MSLDSKRWDLAAALAAGQIRQDELPALAHQLGTDQQTIQKMALMVSKIDWSSHD